MGYFIILLILNLNYSEIINFRGVQTVVVSADALTHEFTCSLNDKCIKLAFNIDIKKNNHNKKHQKLI